MANEQELLDKGGADDNAVLDAPDPGADAAAPEPKLGATQAIRREDLIQRMREKSAASEAASAASAAAAAVADGADGADAGEPDQTGSDQQQDQPVPVERPHKLRVDHQDVNLSDEEMRQAAQIGLASMRRMNDLNETLGHTKAELAEIQRIRQGLSQGGDSRGSDAEPDHRETPTRARDDEADLDDAEILERIRYGQDDEALEAVRRLRPRQDAASPDDIADLAIQRFEQRQVATRNIEAFAKAHPDVAASYPLQEVAGKIAHGRFVREMHEKLGIPIEALRPAFENHQVAVDWYQDYRDRGFTQLTDPREVIEYGVTELEKALKLTPAARQQETQVQPDPARRQQAPGARQEAKLREVQSQPRRMTAAPRPTATPSSAPRTAKEIVNDMRRARGQTILGGQP